MKHFDQNNFKGKKVLITGNTGFKGTWLSLILHSFGSQVYGISKTDTPLSGKNFNGQFSDILIKQFYFDISDMDLFEKAFKEIQPDLVFHLAAQPLVGDSYKYPHATLNSNVTGTLNLLEILRIYNKECQAVFITSDKCYKIKSGQLKYSETDELGGYDPYSFSKSMQEKLVELFYTNYWNKTDSLIRTCTLRSGNVIGGGDFAPTRLLPDCFQSILLKENLFLRNPDAVRPWIYVLDAIDAYLTAAAFLMKDSGFSGESFNVGPESDQMIKVRSLIEKFNARFKKEEQIAIKEENKKLFHESDHLFLNVEKIQEKLNWQCKYSIEESIIETADWYQYFKENEQHIQTYTMNLIAKFYS